MNFTPSEMKLIERLRKQEARWLVLVAGVIPLGLCTVWGDILHGLMLESDLGRFDGWEDFFIAFSWTKCCFYFFCSVWCLITVCLNWRGDANRILLLKLADIEQEAV